MSVDNIIVEWPLIEVLMAQAVASSGYSDIDRQMAGQTGRHRFEQYFLQRMKTK